MISIKPPYKILCDKLSVFLAGSIEMGVADNWQERVENKLSNVDIIIFNPRRDNWNINWEQSINNIDFVEQVEWELDSLNKSDIIIMYLDPNTKSPISLLELGLYAHSNKIIVCCPDGFYRKGNVDVVCRYYNIPVYESIDDMINYILNRL